MLVPLNMPSYEAPNRGITISSNQIMLHRSCVFLLIIRAHLAILSSLVEALMKVGEVGPICKTLQTCVHSNYPALYVTVSTTTVIKNNNRFPSFSKAVLEI